MSAGNDREFIDHLQNKEKGGRSMKCPLLTAAEMSHEPELKPVNDECLKEECGGWDKVLKQCIAISIGDWLENIHSILSGMLDKMPHEEQFRR